jgi:hypothetical protein
MQHGERVCVCVVCSGESDLSVGGHHCENAPLLEFEIKGCVPKG